MNTDPKFKNSKVRLVWSLLTEAYDVLQIIYKI